MNYDVIVNLINNYSMTVEDAIEHYKKNGQKIPTNWIYEKYGLLFKHLMLYFKINPDRIVKIMKKDNCDVKFAIEKFVFFNENSGSEFSLVQKSLLFEIYQCKNICDDFEYEQLLQEFYIDKDEMDFINEKNNEIERINREILLFDLSQVVNEWDIEELVEIMDEYDITEQEVVKIYSSLYTSFENKILTGKDSDKRKNSEIEEKFIQASYKDDEITLINKLKDTNLIEKQNVLKTIIQIQNTITSLETYRENKTNKRN